LVAEKGEGGRRLTVSQEMWFVHTQGNARVSWACPCAGHVQTQGSALDR